MPATTAIHFLAAYLAFSLVFWAAVLIIRARHSKQTGKVLWVFVGDMPLWKRIAGGVMIVLYGLPLAIAAITALAVGRLLARPRV